MPAVGLVDAKHGELLGTHLEVAVAEEGGRRPRGLQVDVVGARVHVEGGGLVLGLEGGVVVALGHHGGLDAVLLEAARHGRGRGVKVASRPKAGPHQGGGGCLLDRECVKC